jgi:hypothetical protein
MSSTTPTTTTTGNLQKNFYTHFGDRFNGLWINWQHDANQTGTKTMTMTLTANLYSAAKDYFLFGQTMFLKGSTNGNGSDATGLTLSTKDTAVVDGNGIVPVWDYCPKGATVNW